mgnify:CR=1 FL=1|jgi:hypothetical protein
MTTQPFEAESQQPEQSKFEIDQEVKVVRTGGELEDGWKVNSFSTDGKSVVLSKKTITGDKAHVLNRTISVAVLEQMQTMKPFFRTGDPVYISRNSGENDLDGWEVDGYREEGGELMIQVVNNQQGLQKSYTEQELKQMQADLVQAKLDQHHI